MKWLQCFWYDMNRRYCEVECYLALNRGETMNAIHLADQAYYWKRCYQMRHML